MTDQGNRGMSERIEENLVDADGNAASSAVVAAAVVEDKAASRRRAGAGVRAPPRGEPGARRVAPRRLKVDWSADEGADDADATDETEADDTPDPRAGDHR